MTSIVIILRAGTSVSREIKFLLKVFRVESPVISCILYSKRKPLGMRCQQIAGMKINRNYESTVFPFS